MTSNKKRKSVEGRVLEETEQSDINEDAPTETRAPKSTARPRKAPRPYVEIVEIQLDEDEHENQPRLTGALRGLDPRAVIPPTQPSVETENEDVANTLESAQSVQHVTRQSRNGKSEANYDMKYHPMDEVTRPKRAAKRRSTSALPNIDDETDDESLPTSARASDASSETPSNEFSDEEVELIARIPDPKATRRSVRDATQKAVDYSAKHHPQDYALPGFKHKAKARKTFVKDGKRSVSSTPRPAKMPRATVDLTNEAIDEESMAEREEEPSATETTQGMEQRTHSPRKKLRTLTDIRKRGQGRKANLKKPATETGSDVVNLLGSINDPSKKALTSSEAELYYRLTQKIEKYMSTQRLDEESDEDPADDLRKLEDLHSLQNHDTHQFGDDDTFMFMDQGNSSDRDTGTNKEQNGTTMHNPEAQSADDTSNGFLPGNHTRKDSHQSQEPPPPPSQFDEQLAVTEIRPKAADGGPAGDPMSSLEAYLRGDALRDRDHSGQSAKSDARNSLPTTTRPNLVPQEDTERSNMNEPSSIADKDRYNTPNTSHCGSNQASRQHSRSKGEEITAEQDLTHLARADGASEVEKRNSKPESTEIQQPSDVDDDLLRHLHSSQRTRSEMIESDPTTVGSEF